MLSLGVIDSADNQQSLGWKNQDHYQPQGLGIKNLVK